MNVAQRPEPKNVSLQEGFWKNIHRLVRETVLPFQWKILCDEIPDAPKSHGIENFRIAAGDREGAFYGCVFQDSDVAKWLEAVAYALAAERDDSLESLADEVIAIIGRAQRPDGYVNTYYILNPAMERFTNLRDDHELYCAGHLMEAAVAYYEATGKRALLDIMLRMARAIDRELGPEPGKRPGYPGHPEIELALMRMYAVTGEEFLFKLAKWFVDARGTDPKYFDWEQETYHSHYKNMPYWFERSSYRQAHLPVREQQALDGHCVRGLYLLSGMIDVATKSSDEELFRTCERLFESVVNRRMYVTGSVGATVQGEAFTLDYDLPNDTIYAETCASIALIFAAQRMLDVKADARYADIIERTLYNGSLASMGMDGKSFFYVNPLEVDPEKSLLNPERKHVLPARPKWFRCACCPPNIARLALSIGQYLYNVREDRVYLNQFVSSTAALDVQGKRITLTQRTNYPIGGEVEVEMDEGEYALNVRLPAWSGRTEVEVNAQASEYELQSGYAVLRRAWRKGDVVTIRLDMKPRRIYANPKISADAGKVALARGPLVYCMEQADNFKGLHRASLRRSGQIREAYEPELLGGIVRLSAEGERIRDDWDELYREDVRPAAEPCELQFIPYHAWANRALGEMQVWVRETQ